MHHRWHRVRLQLNHICNLYSQETRRTIFNIRITWDWSGLVWFGLKLRYRSGRTPCWNWGPLCSITNCHKTASCPLGQRSPFTFTVKASSTTDFIKRRKGKINMVATWFASFIPSQPVNGSLLSKGKVIKRKLKACWNKWLWSNSLLQYNFIACFAQGWRHWGCSGFFSPFWFFLQE